MSGREYWFALASVEGVGPIRIKKLLHRFGSIEAIFEAELSDIARMPLFNPLLAARILKARIRLPEFRRQMKWFHSRGIEILCPEDRDYPEQLKAIPDAPPILCKKGNLSQISQKAVAIVGATTPTDAGILATLELSTLLAQTGFIVVSGLAKGIDATAHLGALSANGTTVGVLGCDLFSIYPNENRDLAEQICESGALLSEHPFTTQPTPVNLILRNRIISGLSMATIVVESSENGGAMRTGRLAMEQNRILFACDWKKPHRLSEGPRLLIQEGAYPVSLDHLDETVGLLLNPDSLRKVQSAPIAGEQMSLF
jgi:DNA processing protein